MTSIAAHLDPHNGVFLQIITGQPNLGLTGQTNCRLYISQHQAVGLAEMLIRAVREAGDQVAHDQQVAEERIRQSIAEGHD